MCGWPKSFSIQQARRSASPSQTCCPTCRFSGGRGFQSADMASLFTGPAVFWLVAGNAAQPLFDGFTLLHQERATQAAYEQAAWTYRTTVIGAFRTWPIRCAPSKRCRCAQGRARFRQGREIPVSISRNSRCRPATLTFSIFLMLRWSTNRRCFSLYKPKPMASSDTAALFQALGGGWWNRVGPPAPEQKLDVATGQFVPVTGDRGWDLVGFFRSGRLAVSPPSAPAGDPQPPNK